MKVLYSYFIYSLYLTSKSLKRILSKPFPKRVGHELEYVAELIQGLKYFTKIVNDPKERLDFVTKCAQYLKYEFFPKGFEVVRRGRRLNERAFPYFFFRR